MDHIINTNELIDQKEKGVHISIYMPLEREPDKTEMNQTRLKNLIKKGESTLAEADFLPSDVSRPDPDQFFQPAREFSNKLYRKGFESEGLAIFLGPTIQRVHTLPFQVSEAIYVQSRFHIRPLLPLFSPANEFYLLSLSQEEIQLWHGNQFELEKVDVPQLPEDMAQALALEDPERALQFHTSTGQTGSRSAVHHGHEADKEKKGAILRYFREVNDAIMDGLAGQKAPLLLAAVDYLIPIYEEANTYPHLMDEGVIGNPDHLNSKELHERAWQTAESHFEGKRNTIIEQFREVKGTNISSQKVEDIVPAAVNGRVKTLLTPKDSSQSVHGFFNQESNAVERCQESSYKCGDLINLAAIETLKNSGEVYTFKAEELPSESDIAAIYRYELQPA